MVKISKSILRTGIPRYWQEIVYPLFASVVLYFCDGNTRNDIELKNAIVSSCFSFCR